jgi:hypothetical protein
MKAIKFIGFGIVGTLGLTALVALTGLVVMLLWNALLPSLFGLAAITFWQAVGLALLVKVFGLLLRGHRHPPHPMARHHARRHGPCGPWHRKPATESGDAA